jgi:hypothetical protein
MGTKALSQMLDWLQAAPPNTSVDAAEMAARIAELVDVPDSMLVVPPELSWREKLWIVPEETRIGREELLEAVGRPASWIYRHTSSKADCVRIPHRKLDGDLVFVVGEVRRWLNDHEEVIVKGHLPSPTAPSTKRALNGVSRIRCASDGLEVYCKNG